MSGQVYGEGFAVLPEAILYAPVSSNAKVLWAVYARHADKEGRSYPGRRRLAELLYVSDDTITRAKKELVDAGLIAVKERFDEEGRRTTDDVFLRHARRTDAAGVRRTDAATGSRPRKNEISNSSATAKTGGTPGPTWVRPPNFVEDLDQLPEKQIEDLDDEAKERMRQRIRLLKGGQP